MLPPFFQWNPHLPAFPPPLAQALRQLRQRRRQHRQRFAVRCRRGPGAAEASEARAQLGGGGGLGTLCG